MGSERGSSRDPLFEPDTSVALKIRGAEGSRTSSLSLIFSARLHHLSSPSNDLDAGRLLPYPLRFRPSGQSRHNAFD